MNKQIYFSIIIPTLNNYKEKNSSIYYVIKSVILQSFANYELIVIDTGCTDNTIKEILDIKHDIKVVKCSTNNCVANARNIGALNSSGEYLIFLDDDTVLTEIDILSKLFDLSKNYDFMCGANRLWSSIYWYKQISKRQSTTSSIQTLKNISFLPKGINREIGFRDLNEFTFIGNFGIIKKSIFQKVNGFDENYIGWGLEDTDLIMHLCMGDFKYTLLKKHNIDVIHLTHISKNTDSHSKNQNLFNQKEQEYGIYFHINHFFDVYEADGISLFTEI